MGSYSMPDVKVELDSQYEETPSYQPEFSSTERELCFQRQLRSFVISQSKKLREEMNNEFTLSGSLATMNELHKRFLLDSEVHLNLLLRENAPRIRSAESWEVGQFQDFQEHINQVFQIENKSLEIRLEQEKKLENGKNHIIQKYKFKLLQIENCYALFDDYSKLEFVKVYQSLKSQAKKDFEKILDQLMVGFKHRPEAIKAKMLVLDKLHAIYGMTVDHVRSKEEYFTEEIKLLETKCLEKFKSRVTHLIKNEEMPQSFRRKINIIYQEVRDKFKIDYPNIPKQQYLKDLFEFDTRLRDSELKLSAMFETQCKLVDTKIQEYFIAFYDKYRVLISSYLESNCRRRVCVSEIRFNEIHLKSENQMMAEMGEIEDLSESHKDKLCCIVLSHIQHKHKKLEISHVQDYKYMQKMNLRDMVNLERDYYARTRKTKPKFIKGDKNVVSTGDCHASRANEESTRRRHDGIKDRFENDHSNNLRRRSI